MLTSPMDQLDNGRGKLQFYQDAIVWSHWIIQRQLFTPIGGDEIVTSCG